MKNKVKLISFSIVFILLASLIIPKAYALYQGKSLMREGDNLLASNQYQPALEKYQQSKEKWENKNINEKIEKAKRLIESNKNYQEGSEAIENEQWDEAIKKLSKVNHDHEHYQEALQLIKYASGEKQNQKKVAPGVKGVSTTTPTTPKPTTASMAPTEAPTPTNTPIPVPLQEPTPISQETEELRIRCMELVSDCYEKCLKQFEAAMKENDAIRERMSNVNPMEVDKITKENRENAIQQHELCQERCEDFLCLELLKN